MPAVEDRIPDAYIVFIKESTHNPDELARYGQLGGPSFTGHPVSFLATYGAHEVLEGPPVEGVVILRFPDMAAARGWYFSPAYQEAVQHRFNGATYRAVMVEGRLPQIDSSSASS